MANKRITQADQVLSYLGQKESINSIEAFGMYGITRLAAVIYKLRGKGHQIESIERKGIRGRYTEYHMA